MCGRFSLTVSPDELQAAFPGFVIPEDLPPSYNIAPSQPIPVIPNDGSQRLDFFRWGLVPSWADEKFLKYNLINARGETAAEKPSYRSPFRRRRCLVLADGFYEWQKPSDGGSKIPYYITRKDRKPFAFAGLWDIWHSPHGDQLRSAAILTIDPNELVKPIHERMPVILPREDYPLWLAEAEQDPEVLQPLIKPYPAEELQAYPVSTYVNNPQHDDPRAIEPVQP